MRTDRRLNCRKGEALAFSHFGHGDLEEQARSEALRDYGFTTPSSEQDFSRILRLVAELYNVSHVYISLVDADHQWFYANKHIQPASSPRDQAICAHVVDLKAPLVVGDVSKDARFAGSAGVSTAPFMRFYAGVPLRTDEGVVIGALCIFHEKPRVGLSEREIDRLQDFADIIIGEANLRRVARQRDESRAFLERAVDFSEMVMWQLDPETDRAYLSGAVEEMWGEGAQENLQTSADVIQVIHPEDQEFVRSALLRSTQHRKPFHIEFRVMNPQRGVRWMAAKSDWAVLNEKDYLIGINTDITEQKNRQDHSTVLMRELHHRMRNLFATMGAIVSLTRQSAENIDDYYERIIHRLEALNRAQNVLLSANFMMGSMHALMREVEAGFPRIQWSGPDLDLPENALVSMALLLNELATNAVKHGALIYDRGAVTVVWGHEDGPDGNRLFHLRWEETGAGNAIAEPERTRFGTLLMERSVRNNLGGRIERRWDSDGLVCDIYLPARWRKSA